MGRIKLALPNAFSFSTHIPLRITDINYGGHLGNDALLGLLHEARVRFLRDHGYTETNIDRIGILMSDAVLVYKSQAFSGETLRIDVAVDDMQRCGCDIVYRVTAESDAREVARAKTGIVFYDYDAGKVKPVPAGFRERFGAE